MKLVDNQLAALDKKEGAETETAAWEDHLLENIQ